MLKAEYKV